MASKWKEIGHCVANLYGYPSEKEVEMLADEIESVAEEAQAERDAEWISAAGFSEATPALLKERIVALEQKARARQASDEEVQKGIDLFRLEKTALAILQGLIAADARVLVSPELTDDQARFAYAAEMLSARAVMTAKAFLAVLAKEGA